MWRNVFGEERNKFLVKAIEFTGNAELYGKWMIEVTKQWLYSCEMNLTNISINRQAWIGRAACCLAINCPEDITRLAWHNLTKEQQDEANKKADEAISLWEDTYKKNTKEGMQLCLKLD